MRRKHVTRCTALAALLMGLFLSESVLAEKPDRIGSDDNREVWRNKKNDRSESRPKNRDEQRGGKDFQRRDDHQDYYGRHDRRGNENDHTYFNDQHRVYIHDYYTKHYRDGRCPPGLYKKHNDCTPPGHDRRWRRGYPLPRDVIFYDLPPSVVMQLGPPPPRHRYVRVAADILLIAMGTGMVVDAIEDLDHY